MSSCHILLVSVRGGGGGRIFTRGGDIFLRIPLWGELVLRIFSPPEKFSGGRFCPVTPAWPYSRVPNRKGRRIQNKFVSLDSSTPTLGKIETTPQIGYAFGKVREKAILNHKPKYKKNGYVTKTMCIGAGIQTVMYTTSRGYFESLTTGVVWRTPQITSKVVYLSASAPAPMCMVLVT